MPNYRADIDETRTFPSLGVTLNPGDIVATPEAVDAVGLTLIDDGKVTANVIAEIAVAPEDPADGQFAPPPHSDVPDEVDTPEPIDTGNTPPPVPATSKPAPGAATTSATPPSSVNPPPAAPTPNSSTASGDTAATSN